MAILGIDEVGRGPWAGPLVVGAVVLCGKPIEGLTDSKKLTAMRRTALAKAIRTSGASLGLGWVAASEIDAVGLSAALRLATRRAVQQITASFHEIIIDGTVNFLSGTKLENYVTVLPKADLLIPEVSAASIVAKVARDAYMIKLAEQYPDYGFEHHVGYGTAAHRTALLEYGTTPEHRHSFKPVEDLKTPTTKQLGGKAETAIASYLESQGHQILACNWKTKLCEIDIISRDANHTYFTEVKYRKTPTHGSSLDAITKDKLKRMHFAAETYMHHHKPTGSPILAVGAVSGKDFQIDDWFTLS